MSQFDQHQIPVAYPPSHQPMEANGPQQMPPSPPVGYPTTAAFNTDAPSSTDIHHTTQTRGDGFWKGCCAALCCCCVLDACF